MQRSLWFILKHLLELAWYVFLNRETWNECWRDVERSNQSACAIRPSCIKSNVSLLNWLWFSWYCKGTDWYSKSLIQIMEEKNVIFLSQYRTIHVFHFSLWSSTWIASKLSMRNCRADIWDAHKFCCLYKVHPSYSSTDALPWNGEELRSQSGN